METFTINAVNPPNQFNSTTTVYTRDSNVGVTAHMLVNLASDNASGVTGQALEIHLETR